MLLGVDQKNERRMQVCTKSQELVYQLIYDNKLRRWFQLLALLEDATVMNSFQLSNQLQITRRTIVLDVKELNQQFIGMMEIIGDDQGYSIRLLVPRAYYWKKQQLLASEPLFLLLDGLFQEKKYKTKDWINYLGLNAATFQRCQKYLETVLQPYQITLVKENFLSLKGAETHLRLFYYYLYYEQPILPPYLVKRKQNYEKSLSKNSWGLPFAREQKRSMGWAVISYYRQQNGYFLSQKKKLAQEVIIGIKKAYQSTENQQFKEDTFPIFDENQNRHVKDKEIGDALLFETQTEFVCHFLFSLDEYCFVDPKLQQLFVDCFSTTSLKQQLETYNKTTHLESSMLLFLGTWVYLMDQFELLSSVDLPQKSTVYDSGFGELFSSLGNAYFQELATQSKQKKSAFRYEVIGHWQFQGTLMVQQWIKEFFIKEAQKMGIKITDEPSDLFVASYLPQVQVTNFAAEKQPHQLGLRLSEIPEQTEIRKACQGLKKYLEIVRRNV